MATGSSHTGGLMARQHTLIVNNLPDYFTEEELKSTFKMYGSVKSVRIARNQTNNKTLGYGFVEYENVNDAKKAIENVDGLQLGKKKMRVAFSEPIDDSLKQASKLLVKQIPWKYDEDQLKQLFVRFGRIVKVRILRDSVTNRSRRVGFVYFERWGDAQKAATAMNEFLPEHAKDKLKVKLEEPSVKPAQWPQWQKSSDQSGPSSPQRGPHPYAQTRPHSQQVHGRKIQPVVTAGPSPACVFLYNIGEYVTEQEIYNLFAQFGGLKKIDIVRDVSSQICKGYAFLTFDSYQASENAIYTMDGMFYRGRQLQVRFKYN
ncbi:Polyadenylate-binding protein 4 [Mactra antiquata]